MPVRSENRARIVIEILEALIGVWGPGRVGVKISPTMAINKNELNCKLERLPGGACTHWKAPPCHCAHPERTSRAARVTIRCAGG